MKRLCILNVVGLTPELARYAPRLTQLGKPQPFRSPLPAVTCTSQATMLTGLPPSKHGIVGNGWYYRDTQEVRFWQQANSLVQGEKFYEPYAQETAKLFWWFNQSAPVRWSVTPKPHYGSDGSKVFDVLDHTQCDLQRQLGAFPFSAFWGPMAGLPSSNWIADAAATVMRRHHPRLTMVYLPHLDYDYQRFSQQDPARVAEVDACAGKVIDAASAIGAETIAVSEYGLVPVSQPVYLNRVLRDAGLLQVRDGPFGEMLLPGDSQAFAVVDHQLAHIYVNDLSVKEKVRQLLSRVTGVASVVEPQELDLHHSRAGELIALAEPQAWFVYYYWLDDRHAPDFARCVDIHRKPGYDPCELFITSKMRAMLRLLQKKSGMRYRMDVIPLAPDLVRGSHGLHPAPEHGPVIIGANAPNDMVDFKDYVRSRL